MFRERLRARREERRGASYYQMRQRLFSLGDDYWIQDERGERVFKIDGKVLRLRKTLMFENSEGEELLKIQERAMRIRDTIEIEDPSGRTVATVRKALISPLRERWKVSIPGASDLDVRGNIVDHEYVIENDHKAGEVSKKWFRVADTYGVEVAPGHDPVLILAIAAVLDLMAHDER